MAYIDQKNYYTNDAATPTNANWGSYQYVSLKNIIGNFFRTCDFFIGKEILKKV